MATITVAGGIGIAPTEMAAYDSALADANLHNYNLVPVSSVVPADATVQAVDRVPDLGPAGNRLTVVQAKRVVGPTNASTSESPSEIAAGLGWATGPGPGLFYEVTGTDPDAVRSRIHDGLDAGETLREWELPDRETCVRSVEPATDACTCVVVIAAYGRSDPIV